MKRPVPSHLTPPCAHCCPSRTTIHICSSHSSVITTDFLGPCSFTSLPAVSSVILHPVPIPSVQPGPASRREEKQSQRLGTCSWGLLLLGGGGGRVWRVTPCRVTVGFWWHSHPPSLARPNPRHRALLQNSSLGSRELLGFSKALVGAGNALVFARWPSGPRRVMCL